MMIETTKPTATKAPAPSESAPAPLEEAEREFLETYPEFASTREIDELRRREMSRLDEQGHVYLDYTGGGLYAETQVRNHGDLLLSQVFGNPHSTNPTSLATTELVERCRRRLLEFFRAPSEEYVAIFTSNASHALKLVGESYPFERGDRLLLTFDNHNSVNGIREFDRAHGAETQYVSVRPPEMRVDEAELESRLTRGGKCKNRLFAYPAQSNFSGVQHPLEWIEKARSHGWDVLLDAAAFVPTNRLDLSVWNPDYVALSFYKMFGYPTGVGALIGRREALAKLHRPWFAGGTIEVASVQADRYQFAEGAAAFEDGTLDYTNIPAVEIGLDFIESVGLERIHLRVACLAEWLIERLLELRYPNGQPLVQVYGPRGRERRGGTVAMNFFEPSGEVIDHEWVEERANRRRISLRTGCFCNPGAGEVALGLERDEISRCFTQSDERKMTYDAFRHCLATKGTGAVRVSVGLATNFADVHTFLEFARSFLEDGSVGGGG